MKNIDLNKRSQTELPIEQNIDTSRSQKGMIFGAILLISLCVYLALNHKHEITAFFGDKNKSNKVEPKVEYVKGLIVLKTLGIDNNPRILRYRNDKFDTYTITDPGLWGKAELGDSVKVGFTEKGESQENYSLVFKSVDVIGKVKMDTIYGGVIAKTLDVRTDGRALVIKDSYGKVYVIRDSCLWNRAARWDSVKLRLPVGTDLKKSGPIDFATIDVIGKARTDNDIEIFSSEDQTSNTTNTATAASRRKTTSSGNLRQRIFFKKNKKY